MEIFVTGGTGFIGNHFIRRAIAAGHTVTALYRKESNVRIPLSSPSSWLGKPIPEISESDLQRHNVLVHLAAHSAMVPYDCLSECLRWTVYEPAKLFEKAARAGIKRFIVAGTGFEYGKSGERYEFIPVTAPLEPTQTYPISKAAASIAFAGLAREIKVEMLIGRIFQVYGEGELETRLWPSLRAKALSGSDLDMSPGEQVRDFIPVEDVAAYFAHAIDRADLFAARPLIENVGTGRPQTVRAFAEYWWKEWKAKGQLRIGTLPYRDNEVMRYVPQLQL